jgi:hypothetical protein
MQYKLTDKSKENQLADIVKKILTSSIDPIEMKIGIRTFKGLQDGNVLIKADTKIDIEIYHQIRNKCGERLETNAQKMKNPRFILYNIPDEIIPENSEEITIAQNRTSIEKGRCNNKFHHQIQKECKKSGN